MLFAITDIETTGSHASANSITEIAVCVHDGTQIVEEYQTLLRPDRSIPLSITALTGIDDEMVENAPTFEEIADELYAILKGKVFVAHNVNFDYSFIRSAFEHVEKKWQPAKLCTVRLTRKLIPGLPSYSLGNICRSLGIPNEARHRAYGDAKATCELFGKLFALDEDKYIEKTVKRGSADAFLPNHVSKEDYEKLPHRPGVYYFKDAKGKLIYIGKAIDLKKRVRTHFGGSMKGERKQAFIRDIHHISFEETGCELVALLLEDHEIRSHWPKYNLAQKKRNLVWGIYTYTDQKGAFRLSVQKLRASGKPVKKFNSMWKARTWLFEVVEEKPLIPSYCGLDPDPECEIDLATHNAAMAQLINEQSLAYPEFAIKERGREPQEQSFVSVENGEITGYGFISKEESIAYPSDLEPFLNRITASATSYGVLHSYCQLHPENVLAFHNTED